MVDSLIDEVAYIYYSSKVIIDSLRKGCDVVQFSNGDIIATQIIRVNKEYKWSKRLSKVIETVS